MDTSSIDIVGRLLEMSEIELKVAYGQTDNEKFKQIISDTLNNRFPKEIDN